MDDALRDQLLAAADSPAALEALCREHREAIEDRYPGWKSVPESLREDASAIEDYVGGLLAIARTFERVFDDTSLLQFLLGVSELQAPASSEPSPAAWWDRALEEARTHLQEARYEEARRVLTELVPSLRDLDVPGSTDLLSVALGMLGSASFNAGHVDEAARVLDEAIELSRSEGADDITTAHQTSLHEVERYRGHAERAAELAEAVAKALSDVDADEAANWRVRAQTVREAEPPLRVMLLLGNRTAELDELRPEDIDETAPLRFVYERNRTSIGASSAKSEAAKALAESGRMERALELFEEAAKLDPHDPTPHYHMGLIHLEQGRYADAVASYDRVEAVAPGWYLSREDRWLAQQLESGELEPNVLHTIRAVEDSDRAPRAKLTLAMAGLERTPELARLWLEAGRLHLRLGEAEQARDCFEKARTFAPEPACETRALADLAGVTSEPARRAELALRAIELGGDLVAAASARVVALLTRQTAH